MFISLDNMLINTDNIETMQEHWDEKQNTVHITMISKKIIELEISFETFKTTFWNQINEQTKTHLSSFYEQPS